MTISGHASVADEDRLLLAAASTEEVEDGPEQHMRWQPADEHTEGGRLDDVKEYSVRFDRGRNPSYMPELRNGGFDDLHVPTEDAAKFSGAI